MNKTVVKVVKSGVRFNAFDSKGQKYTSQITTGARKKAYANNMALEQRVNKAGKTYWWAVPMSMFEATESTAMETPCLLYTSPSPRDVEESRMPCSA